MSEPVFPNATEEQINEGKSLAWLSYFGWLCVIPLVVQKDNPFTMYHARQGLLLSILLTALWIVGLIIWIPLRWLWWCGWLWIVLLFLVSAAVGILALIGLIQAITGKFWKMPILGDLAEKWFSTMVPGA